MTLTAVRCATCQKQVAHPSANRSFPFCCPRCQLIDLGKWVDGTIGIDPVTGRLAEFDPDDDDDGDEVSPSDR